MEEAGGRGYARVRGLVATLAQHQATSVPPQNNRFGPPERTLAAVAVTVGRKARAGETSVVAPKASPNPSHQSSPVRRNAWNAQETRRRSDCRYFTPFKTGRNGWKHLVASLPRWTSRV